MKKSMLFLLTFFFAVFFVFSSMQLSFISLKTLNFAWTLKVVNVIHHTVKKGETLNKIALKYGVSIKDIIYANGIKNPNEIKPGQKIKIPLNKIKGEVLI